MPLSSRREGAAGFSFGSDGSASALLPETTRVMTALSRMIESSSSAPGGQVVAFLGVHRGEGAAVLTREFAKTASARLGKSVLLLDANPGRDGREGIAEDRPHRDWRDAVLDPSRLDEVVERHGESNLSVGRLSASDDFAPAFSLPGIEDFMAALRKKFDLVVLDLPPAGVSLDGIAFSNRTDGVVLVVESERTRWQVAVNVKNHIVRLGGKVLCAILNKRRDIIPDFIYKRI